MRGEGCGVVVLKRLADALAPTATASSAVIRGTAVNQDGRSSGLTAPNGPAQEAVIRAALGRRRRRRRATSTTSRRTAPAPRWATRSRCRRSARCSAPARPADQPLLVGSVKTNIGHLEAAAGIAGLIKAVLALRARARSRRTCTSRRSTRTSSSSCRWSFPRDALPWPTDAVLAGVSSFGFSGTNAHVVMGAAPAPQSEAKAADPATHVLPLSAALPDALANLARAFARELERGSAVRLADVCYTAATGRAHQSERLAVVGASASEIAEKLLAAADGADLPGVIRGRITPGHTPTTAFLFTGQGAQYVGMARGLYDTQPVFRAAIDRCDELLRSSLERPLLSALYPSDEGSHLLDSLEYAQPGPVRRAVRAHRAWRTWGITPEFLLGHSVGEFAAACAAGVFSLGDGLRLVAARGRLLQSLPADSEMVAIFEDEQRVAHALAPYADAVAIAAINGPTSTTVAGRSDGVQAVIGALGLSSDRWRRLDVARASHTPLVDPILDAFERVAADVSFHRPRLAVVSSVSGALATGDDLMTPAYWRRQMRQPVRFGDAMTTLQELGCDTFLEIGPHPTLLGLGRRCLGERLRHLAALVAARLAGLRAAGRKRRNAVHAWRGDRLGGRRSWRAPTTRGVAHVSLDPPALLEPNLRSRRASTSEHRHLGSSDCRRASPGRTSTARPQPGQLRRKVRVAEVAWPAPIHSKHSWRSACSREVGNATPRVRSSSSTPSSPHIASWSNACCPAWPRIAVAGVP